MGASSPGTPESASSAVAEERDVIRLDRQGGTIVDEAPVGRIASDGKSLLPLRGTALRERQRVGLNGAVIASLVLDRRGWPAAPPQITLIGLAEANAAPAMALRDAVADGLEGQESARAREKDVSPHRCGCVPWTSPRAVRSEP